MKKKIFLSILIIIIFTFIGICIGMYKSYLNNEKAKTSKYYKEIQEILSLDGNKSVIKIIKEDMDYDNFEDYIILLAEEKYDETTNTSNYFDFNRTLEMYNNVSIEYINGNTKEANRYNTNKSYGTDVDISLTEFENKIYILLSDTITGNISVLYLNDKVLNDYISSSFENFAGYTIDANIDDNEKKLKIKLDNYGRNYLDNRSDEFVIDLNETNVNSNTYRPTYMANKYGKFELKVDEDNNLSLIATQYVLYSNDKTLEKNFGRINIKFCLDKNDNKFKFSDVIVEK